MNRSMLSLLTVAMFGAAGVAAREPVGKPSTEVVPLADVEWSPLNPARGDKGPRAGVLWGDRTGARPSGFLVKFTDGFASPPHIHNITYRGVVISGLVHNDDPEAAELWMPTASYWTQPAGEVHITSAKGKEILTYIEIQEGPYLVLPPEKAVDNGQRPVNVHASNLVWLDASTVRWIRQPASRIAAQGPKVAFLWGTPKDGQLSGTLIKLPAGYTGSLRSLGSNARAVVIEGRPTIHLHGATKERALEPASYFGSKGKATHGIETDAKGCILYVRSDGAFEIEERPAGPDSDGD